MTASDYDKLQPGSVIRAQRGAMPRRLRVVVVVGNKTTALRMIGSSWTKRSTAWYDRWAIVTGYTATTTIVPLTGEERREIVRHDRIRRCRA